MESLSVDWAVNHWIVCTLVFKFVGKSSSTFLMCLKRIVTHTIYSYILCRCVWYIFCAYLFKSCITELCSLGVKSYVLLVSKWRVGVGVYKLIIMNCDKALVCYVHKIEIQNTLLAQEFMCSYFQVFILAPVLSLWNVYICFQVFCQ